ncbi:MAG: TPM domain-containing protein [Chryseolinea sp.]
MQTTQHFLSYPTMIFRFLIFFLAITITAQAQVALPEHGGQWVHDQANVLSASTKSEIESILKAERDSTSNQIAVLIVPSLEGESMEDFSLRVAEKWQIGQKKKDNGVLMLISINDKKMRIETGYGLEGVLTDALSSRINRNEMAPYFRQGDFDTGVRVGVMAVIQAIKGEYVNDEPVVQTRRRSKKSSPLFTILIIIAIIIISTRNRKGGGGGGGGYWTAAAAGSLLGRGFGGSSGSWGGGGGGSDFGGGGGFGGGGSSDSW